MRIFMICCPTPRFLAVFAARNDARTLAWAAIVLFLAAGAYAQAPSADWRTITTPHFRVHHPAEYSAWSERAASRLESIRAAVVREVGYAPPEVIDVIVANPAAEPNGIAWPILDAPRIILFAEPPGPEDVIGAYSSWSDLVSVHEVAHIVHMLRPSRNPMRRLSEKFLFPLNRITSSAPRWVLEGYATVIEGRLTGSGRPSSTVRAAILRKWAASGRLPSYDQLDSDSRFLGMSMAYLVGSAYLEWLEQRSGPDSLRHVWARMTARHQRSFGEAFTGVFGESPQRLYGQFMAEVTASALAVQRGGALQEGELWQETSHASGDPVVSPDGTKIAVVLRSRNKPPKVVIWSTGPADEEEKKYVERIDKILKADPEDVRPIRTKPLPRKPLHSFTVQDGGIGTPRWLPDGSAILYSRRQPDIEGFLHHDLFLWRPGSNHSVRITHGADVRDAGPRPDGKSAVAVRSRHGFSQLVSVDLVSGEVTPINEPSLDVVYTSPRVNQDGDVAYLVNRNGRWLLERDGRELARDITSFQWSRTVADELIASISTRGFAEIHRIRADAKQQPLTRSLGAAFDPAPSPDGRVFFMSLEPDGLVLRVTNAATPAPPHPAYDMALVPAVSPVPPRTEPFAAAAIQSGRPYGIGRQERGWLFGQVHGPQQSATEVGLRLGDVIGRLDTIAIASLGQQDSPRGGAIASVWRGWPVAVSAHVFSGDDDRADRNGVELRGAWTGVWPRRWISLDAGLLSGKPYDLGFMSGSARLRQLAGDWRIYEELAVAVESGTFEHRRGTVRIDVASESMRVGLSYQRDSIEDGFLEVGGLPSSIIPESAYANRVFQPALAIGALSGRRHEGRRIEASLRALPMTLFVQEHKTDTARARLAGAELTMSSGPIPILRLAGFDLTLGAASQIGKAAEERDLQWWFGLRWRP